MRKDILRSSRKLKRKKFFLKIFFSFFLFLIICACAAWSFYIPQLRIKKVSVEGAEILNTEKIISDVSDYLKGKYFLIIPRDNIFVVSKESIIRVLSGEFPRIKEIFIDKNFPDGLSLKIKERKSEALLCAENTCAYVDESGFVFEKAPYFSGNVFLKFIDEREEKQEIKTGKAVLEKDEFKKLIDFKNFVLREGIKISSVVLKKENNYVLYTDEGWTILLNKKNDVRISVENLKTTLDYKIKENRQKLKYIDLRLSNKVFYYKFK